MRYDDAAGHDLPHLPVESYGIEVLQALRAKNWDGNVTLEYLPQFHDRLIPDRHQLAFFDYRDRTVFHHPVRIGDIDAVRKLLETAIAYINGCNERDSGNTPLHVTCEKGNVEIARILMDHGTYPEEKDAFDCRPLHKAYFYLHPDVVHLHLEARANAGIRDEHEGAAFTPRCPASLPPVRSSSTSSGNVLRNW